MIRLISFMKPDGASPKRGAAPLNPRLGSPANMYGDESSISDIDAEESELRRLLRSTNSEEHRVAITASLTSLEEKRVLHRQPRSFGTDRSSDDEMGSVDEDVASVDAGLDVLPGPSFRSLEDEGSPTPFRRSAPSQHSPLPKSMRPADAVGEAGVGAGGGSGDRASGGSGGGVGLLGPADVGGSDLLGPAGMKTLQLERVSPAATDIGDEKRSRPSSAR